MIEAMSMSLTSNAPVIFQRRLAIATQHSRAVEQERPRVVFLGLVGIALALSVVAVVEPSPGDIGVVLLLVLGFISGKLSWRHIPTLPVTLIGFFVLANLASLCYAIDPSYGASYGLITVFVITLWLFTVGVTTRFEERGLRILMAGAVFGGVVSAALALMAYLGFLSRMPYLSIVPLDETLLFYGERLRGFFKDPNVFGPYLVVMAAYSFCSLQARQSSLARKILWIGSCLICSLGVLLSFSRAAWANYVVTLSLLLTLKAVATRGRGAWRRNIVNFLIVAIIVGAAVAYTLAIPRVNEVASYRSEMQSYDEDRFVKHEEALELGLRNPLGVGPGQSHLLLGYNPHSLPLGVFAENGIIGLLSIMGLALATLIRSLVLSQKATSDFQRSMFALVAATIAGILVNSMVIDSIHWRHFWLLLALGWMPLWTKLTSSTSKRSRETSMRLTQPVRARPIL
jgi:hypothetical protein